MELFSFEAQGHHFALVLDLSLQLERLLMDGRVLSVKPLGQLNSRHQFEEPEIGHGSVSFTLVPEQEKVQYQLTVNEQLQVAAEQPLSDEIKSIMAPVDSGTSPTPKKEKLWVILGSIVLKLTKTLKVAKVALAAASVAVYSVMFTFEFALALVAVLVIHEYGHVRAMKKFGIPTKGMYLIPFFGGVALGDKARTQWEELYIAMMGPVYGLAMTAVFYVAFLISGSHFCGLVASTSALLNLINLFPVYPLDGGRVVKALVFSRRNYMALLLLLTLSAVCLFVAWKLTLVFLVFFIVIGVLDIIAGWAIPLSEDMTPLKTYGIWFSLVWYLAVAVAFIAMILLIAEAQVPGSELAVKILQS